MSSINNLNDDCLIHIFQYVPLSSRLDLPFVCKRFYLLCKNYKLNVIQRNLGIISEKNCNYSQHNIDNEDTIFNLILRQKNCDGNKANYFDPRINLNKFELSSKMLNQLLRRFSKIEVLSLKLIEVIDNQILDTIIKNAYNLTHLTISMTTIQATNWLKLCTSVCAKLKCLNLEYVDNLTEEFIAAILRKSISLENFSVSGNNENLSGYFFENICNRIQSITIRKVETFTNRGFMLVLSLIAGNGRRVRKLIYKGRLSGHFLSQINLIQKNFKKLEELEIGDSLDDTSAAFQRILGQTIAKINLLKKISFTLPQLTPFSITLNSLFTKLIELNKQNNLTSFKMNGGEIRDKSIELLCNNFKQLNEFQLANYSYFTRKNFGLTNQIFIFLSSSTELKKLIINGHAIDDYLLSLILNNCKHLTKIDLRNCWSITNQSLNNLKYYAYQVEQNTLVYLNGTQISLFEFYENHMFSLPSNLQISFEPLKEYLLDFDIIEVDDFNSFD